MLVHGRTPHISLQVVSTLYVCIEEVYACMHLLMAFAYKMYMYAPTGFAANHSLSSLVLKSHSHTYSVAVLPMGTYGLKPESASDCPSGQYQAPSINHLLLLFLFSFYSYFRVQKHLHH